MYENHPCDRPNVQTEVVNKFSGSTKFSHIYKFFFLVTHTYINIYNYKASKCYFFKECFTFLYSEREGKCRRIT